MDSQGLTTMKNLIIDRIEKMEDPQDVLKVYNYLMGMNRIKGNSCDDCSKPLAKCSCPE